MSRVHHQETQVLRDSSFLRYCIIPLVFVSISPLLYGLYWQVGMGKPWGNQPMSDHGLITATVVVCVVAVFVLWLLFSMKLEIKVDHAFHYRLYPVRPRWTTLTHDDIISYEVRARNSFFETGGRGLHRRKFGAVRVISITGNRYLVMKLRDGKTLMISTTNPEGLDRAMKKINASESR